MTARPRKQSDETDMALMARDITYIKKSIDDLTAKVDHNYVTKDQFEPVRKIVYGLVGLILVSVVGALMTLVVTK